MFLFILILVVKCGKRTSLKPAFSLQDLSNAFPRYNFKRGPHTPGQRRPPMPLWRHLCLCAAGSCSVDIAWALTLRRVNGENPTGSIFLGQSRGGRHRCLLRRLSKLPCWDLLLLSRTGMYLLVGIIPLRQTHDLPHSGTVLWLQALKHLPCPSPTGLKGPCLLARGPAGDDEGRGSLIDLDSLLRWWWWGVPRLSTPLPLPGVKVGLLRAPGRAPLRCFWMGL